jgi:hypothetical protein
VVDLWCWGAGFVDRLRPTCLQVGRQGSVKAIIVLINTCKKQAGGDGGDGCSTVAVSLSQFFSAAAGGPALKVPGGGDRGNFWKEAGAYAFVPLA